MGKTVGSTHRDETIITISPTGLGSGRNSRIFNTRNNFFKDEVIVSILVDRIIVKKSTIDTQNGRKFYMAKDKTYQTTILCDIPTGRYEIDEDESTEDKLVIYLNKE